MAADLLSWCEGELERSFGLRVSKEIVQYILSIDTEEEIDEYIHDLIQGSEGRKRQFIEELKVRWQKSRRPVGAHSEQPFHKQDGSEEACAQRLLSGEQGRRGRRKGRNKLEPPIYAAAETAGEEVKTPLDLAKAQEVSGPAAGSSSSSKKKQKFVSLYTAEGQDKLAVLIPGRYPCECLAQKHQLISNCLTCGRIVCEQEGSGPCLFCGNLVCTKEEQDILQRDSNKSQKLLKKLLGGSETSVKMDPTMKDVLPRQEVRLKEGLEKARQHRDRLLEYDKTSVRRTHVIDDESDYFATDSNQWLSPVERESVRRKEEELQELRHASRLSRKVTIDFAGRRVLEEGGDLADYHKRLDETIQALHSGTVVKPSRGPMGTSEDSYLVNPSLLQPPPLWVDQVSAGARRRGAGPERADQNLTRSRLRIQDRELQEMSDEGMCLSMHQPWASLLVTGVKRVEGRTWYSAHRGRLWIAAAAKRPSPQEVSELEASYRVLLQKAPISQPGIHVALRLRLRESPRTAGEIPHERTAQDLEAGFENSPWCQERVDDQEGETLKCPKKCPSRRFRCWA
ncbi:activating signal cointegrator 1 isoform X2 [Ascaphus truei]|uniref:activating signal cointegrator 1 isoform X2 n=1 Tax=Ascaphus truei TaxID=8439 RepID=UPI003F5A61A1